MKREYAKPPLFEFKQLGTLVFAAFVLFMAYTILTPPSDDLSVVASPDATKEARLRRFYYYNNQPSYRIHYRESGRKMWLALYYLPVYTNMPVEQAEPSIDWSDDSQRLDFLMNGTTIWHHSFDEAK